MTNTYKYKWYSFFNSYESRLGLVGLGTLLTFLIIRGLFSNPIVGYLVYIGICILYNKLYDYILYQLKRSIKVDKSNE